MKFVLLILTLFIFGCSVEKRLHRPGFHFKKTSTFQPSKKENNTATPDFTSVSLMDSNGRSRPSKIEHTIKKEQSRTKKIVEKRSIKEAKNFTSSVHTRDKITAVNQKKIADIPPLEKKRELYSREKEPDEENHTLVILANILAIMSFVFGLLTIVSIALAFIMSITLILPLLPALAAFFSGGLSLLLGLPIKQDKYKSGFAAFGLITSLVFFGFFIAVLSGAILI